MFNFIGATPVSQSYQSLLHISSSVAMDGTGSQLSAPYVNTVFKLPQVSGSAVYQDTREGNYTFMAKSLTDGFKFGVYKHNMLVLGEEPSLPDPVVTGSIVFFDGELHLGIEDTLPY